MVIIQKDLTDEVHYWPIRIKYSTEPHNKGLHCEVNKKYCFLIYMESFIWLYVTDKPLLSVLRVNKDQKGYMWIANAPYFTTPQEVCIIHRDLLGKRCSCAFVKVLYIIAIVRFRVIGTTQSTLSKALISFCTVASDVHGNNVV